MATIHASEKKVDGEVSYSWLSDKVGDMVLCNNIAQVDDSSMVYGCYYCSMCNL